MILDKGLVPIFVESSRRQRTKPFSEMMMTLTYDAFKRRLASMCSVWYSLVYTCTDVQDTLWLIVLLQPTKHHETNTS